MAPIIRTCSAIALITAAWPTVAQGKPDALGHYVEGRILDAAGQGGRAAQSYGLALTAAPAEERIALRAYRQALEAGDRKLALRAANALERQGKLPGDGRVLLFVDTVDRGDWRAAHLNIDRMEESGQFSFLAPIFRAWVRFGAREAEPLAPIEVRSRDSLTAAFAREQRVHLLLAMKRIDEGLAATRALAGTDRSGGWLRLSAAARLAELGKRAEALSLLAGTDAAFVRARALVEGGQAMPGGIATPGQGIATVLTRVAADLVRDNSGPSALTMARLASFADPASDSARLVLAQALSIAGYQTPALAEAERFPADSLFSGAVRELRFSALQRAGRDADALAFAEAQARAPQADALDYARLGDALGRAGRNSESARAYGQAIEVAEKEGNQASWNLWLLYGGALDTAGDWARAKPALEKAVSIAPEQPAALNHLGYAMLERKENLTEATRLIAKAAALRPEDAAITDSLGWAFFMRGQTAESIALLERAVAADPTEAALGEHLGDAYWAAGRKIEARYAWRAALVQADGEVQAKRIEARIVDGPPK